jgi:hypothetical protein
MKTSYLIAVTVCCINFFAYADWIELPHNHWTGYHGDVAGLNGKQRCVIAHPAKDASPLVIKSGATLPAGRYDLHLTLSPSHAWEQFSWTGFCQIASDNNTLNTLSAVRFGRYHQHETFVIPYTHSKNGPLELTLSATVDGKVYETTQTKKNLKSGGPTMADTGVSEDNDEDDDLGDLDVSVDRETHFYFVIDKARLKRRSTSGIVKRVMVDKVLYEPGDSLTATIQLEQTSSAKSGKLELELQWRLDEKTSVKTIKVPAQKGSHTFTATIPLPERELGYGLVARFTSDDGKDSDEGVRYFNIADNFMRVAIPTTRGFGGSRSTMRTKEQMQKMVNAGFEAYGNYSEWFAWAEEDMVEMSPDTDYWFSGQTT